MATLSRILLLFSAVLVVTVLILKMLIDHSKSNNDTIKGD